MSPDIERVHHADALRVAAEIQDSGRRFEYGRFEDKAGFMKCGECVQYRQIKGCVVIEGVQFGFVATFIEYPPPKFFTCSESNPVRFTPYPVADSTSVGRVPEP